MRREFTVVVTDVGAPYLGANQRLHWTRQRAHARLWRQAGQRACRSLPRAPMDRVLITATVHWPDGRRRDVHNVMPSIKALIDGVVDSGRVIPDDSDAHLVGPDLRVADTRSAKPRIDLLVLELGPDE